MIPLASLKILLRLNSNVLLRLHFEEPYVLFFGFTPHQLTQLRSYGEFNPDLLVKEDLAQTPYQVLTAS
jgi:hypothetical protein